LTLTEPGIVGKIGLNSAGFGVCLNFLPTENLKPGIPTHILIRRLLSAKNWTDIDIILKNAGSARSANLLIANGDGSSRDLEFDGKAAYKYPGGEFATIHTNHYLATDKPVAEFLFENSDARLTRAEVLISEADELTLELLKEILSDRLDPNHPILSSYRNVPMFSGALGTDCSIVMDLGDLKMHVRRGNNSSAPFECLKI